MTKVVRFFITSSSATSTLDSVAASSALVASSRIRIGGSFRQRARDRQPLTLAARQGAPALAHFGVKPIDVVFDEIERLRPRGGRAHLLVGGVGFADAQIFCDRTIEQQRFLKNHADIAAKRGEFDVPHIHAVDLDESRLRIESAVQQRKRGRLSGSGRAHQRHGLARQRREIQVCDRRPLAVVGKRHVLELDTADQGGRALRRRAGRASPERCRARRKIRAIVAHPSPCD